MTDRTIEASKRDGFQSLEETGAQVSSGWKWQGAASFLPPATAGRHRSMAASGHFAPAPDDRARASGGFALAPDGGITWDGMFHRDTARYPADGELFWATYLRPGTMAGMKAGFWINFGSGWSHLHNDDPAQSLTGASQKLFFDSAANVWKFVIQRPSSSRSKLSTYGRGPRAAALTRRELTRASAGWTGSPHSPWRPFLEPQAKAACFIGRMSERFETIERLGP